MKVYGAILKTNKRERNKLNGVPKNIYMTRATYFVSHMDDGLFTRKTEIGEWQLFQKQMMLDSNRTVNGEEKKHNSGRPPRLSKILSRKSYIKMVHGACIRLRDLKAEIKRKKKVKKAAFSVRPQIMRPSWGEISSLTTLPPIPSDRFTNFGAPGIEVYGTGSLFYRCLQGDWVKKIM